MNFNVLLKLALLCLPACLEFCAWVIDLVIEKSLGIYCFYQQQYAVSYARFLHDDYTLALILRDQIKK